MDFADFPKEMLGGMDETCEAKIKASFRAPASTNTSHYFVDVDPTDLETNDVGGLDREGTAGPHLPTIRDPIVNFSKSIMLTTVSYLAIVKYLQVQINGTTKEKEKKWIEREE